MIAPMTYGGVQVAVAAVFAAVSVALAAFFALAARRTLAEVPLEEVTRQGYRLRGRWLFFLAALLVVVVGLSMFALPYAKGAKGRTVVKVTGGQFYWVLDPPRLPAGAKVRFDVTGADVNHGFSLYDPRGRLLGSVQAMPGYHNTLDVTLSEPGRYRILCFEYCGLSHHLMEATLTVTEG